MSALTALKKRTKKSALNRQEKIKESNENTGNNYTDDRFWSYQADDNGNAQVTIRFLPLGATADETKDTEIVEVFSHAFKGETKQWYIDECRHSATLGKYVEGTCPVCDGNNEYATSLGGWKEMSTAQQNRLRAGGNGRGRRRQYIANVYIVNDKANPENNGKVVLWKFGPFIKKLIDNAIVPPEPEFDDEDVVAPIDPFDLWEGHNFILRVRKVENQTNYAKSSFDKQSQLLPTDEELNDVYQKVISLHEFIDITKFNTYDKQKARLDLVDGVKKVETKSEPLKEEPEKELDDVSDHNLDEEDDEFFDDLLNS